MGNIIEEIIILMQFMTRLPVSFIKTGYTEEKLGKGIKYFPLVGAIIGGILFSAFIFLGKFIENTLIISLVTVILEIFVVGVIHLDGLADTFDGLFSYASKERILEIMKDSRIGTNGGIALILYFIGKILLMGEIASIDVKYILLYPVVSRISTVMNAGLGEYARKDGMSNGIMKENGIGEVVFSLMLTALLSFWIKGLKGLLILSVSVIFILYFMNKVKRKIDGVTGDTMGACLELTSLVVLIGGVIIK